MDNLAGGYVNEKHFWDKVRKTATCWIWMGRTTGGSYTKYGLFYVRVHSSRGPAGRMESTHRLAYELTNGPIPKGKQIRHRCDNGMCVRPDHLVPGTHQENMDDKVRKNRQVRGEAVNTAKLTASQVRQIRERFHRGEFAIDLGKEFGIEANGIERIAFGRTWRHVGGPISKPLGRGFRKAREIFKRRKAHLP